MPYTLPTSAKAAFAIVPSDTVNFSGPVRGIYVGGAGNIAMFMTDGTSALFVGVTAGSILPIECYRVNATGTTATALLGLS